MLAFSSLLGVLSSIIVFILVFGVLVLVHELGHFTAAKLFKVKVEEFGIGLPPKAKVLFKKGETEYTLNWLPLGGFVRMLGENDVEGNLSKDPRSFSAQPVYKRMIIAAAGVIMNLVLAFVIFTGLFWFGAQPLSIIPDEAYPFAYESYVLPTMSFAEEQGLISKQHSNSDDVHIVHIQDDSLASTLGLTITDEHPAILNQLNETTISSALQFKEELSKIAIGETLKLTITQDEEPNIYELIKPDGPIGVLLTDGESYVVNYSEDGSLPTYETSFIEAPLIAAREVGILTLITFDAIGDVVVNIVKNLQVPEEIGGPVQIATVVHEANTNAGLGAVIILAAILSVNLAVFNILPIPALDGGRILFMIYELVFRKKPNQAIEAYIHLIGYSLLLLLIVAVTYNDIVRLLTSN